MKIKVGDVIRVKSPPSACYFGISKTDWPRAIGHTYVVSEVAENPPDAVMLINAPSVYRDASRDFTYYSNHSWWWPTDCIELAAKHPVEVF